MKFLYPEILWALIALAIPVLVHLFNFRKFKKVYFPNVSFLKEIKEETQAKSKLKHLIILATRMLAMAALIFAFAQPFIPTEERYDSTDGQIISLYLDNSFSMEAENKEGPSFEVARNKAVQIIEQYPQTSRFQIIDNNFEGKNQQLLSQAEAIEWLGDIKLGPSSRFISEVIDRQKDALGQYPEKRKSLYLLSDLQGSTTDLVNIEPDSAYQIYFVPTMAEDPGNIFIDSIWFDSPVRQINQAEHLHIRIKNTLQERRDDIPMKLEINGQQRAIGSFSAIAGSYTDTTLYFSNESPGIKKATLTIEDNPVTFDDRFYFSYDVAEYIEVLRIAETIGKANPLSKLFDHNDYFKYHETSSKSIDYAALSGYNLIILDGLKEVSSGLKAEIEQVVSQGGSVLIIPHNEIELTGYNALFSSLEMDPISEGISEENRVTKIDLANPFFDGIFESTSANMDLPKTYFYYPVQSGSHSNSQQLMSLQRGRAFVSQTEHGKGRAYFISAPLNLKGSNFVQHALFVPCLLRIGEFSQSPTPLFYSIGKEAIISLKKTATGHDETFRISNPVLSVDLITESRQLRSSTEVFIHNELQTAGFYDLFLGDKQVAALAFNYDRKESNFSPLSVDVMNETIESRGLSNLHLIEKDSSTLGNMVRALDQGKTYWFDLIVLALVFLAIETLLIKFWR